MRTQPFPGWPWLLFLAGLLFHTPMAAAQEQPTQPQQIQLTPDIRVQLAEQSQDPMLAPWQQEFMLEMAHGNSGLPMAGPSLILPSAVRPGSGIATEDGSWAGLPPPSARSSHTAIYDPVRDRMLVFGGYDGILRNDVWALSLSGTPYWYLVAAAGGPPSGRYNHGAIYDPVRDRMLVFAGFDGNFYLNDVWALSLSGIPAWTQLAPTGTPPIEGWGPKLIYDPVRDRMVALHQGGVWALTLAGTPAWSAIVPAGPPASLIAGQSVIYDPLRDRLLMFGGYDGVFYYDVVWALPLAGSPEWSVLDAGKNVPPGRSNHTAIYDPVGDRMVVFGGYGDFVTNSVWFLTLAGTPTWSAHLHDPHPSERTRHTAILDPVRHRMIVFGGSTPNLDTNDVWALTIGVDEFWSKLAPGGSPPSPRGMHTSIYDPERNRMLMFGGFDGGSALNDVWAVSLAGNPAWSKLTPAGTPVLARYAHSAIYDPVRDRMIVFAGVFAQNMNDVWALSLAGSPTWNQWTPGGSPPPARSFHSAIYDPVRDRMLVFGGGGASGNDVWALSLGASPAWSVLAPTGTPPTARSGHTAIYDPVRDRMIVFGGVSSGQYLNDVWALSLAGSPAWTPLIPTGTPPTARVGHTAIYDPVRDRMVAFGGIEPGDNDAWALSFGGSPAWSELDPLGLPPFGRRWHTAVYDQPRGRMVTFGGLGTFLGYRGDTWALAWGGTVPVPGDDRSVHIALAAPWPNPSSGPVTLNFTVPQSTRVFLVVYDLAGRRIRDLVDGWESPGPHSTVWDGRDQNGRSVPPGVYLVRLSAPGEQVVSKAVIAQGASIH